MKKIIHLPSKCIGCYACVGLAPELFEPNPDTGLARLIGGQNEGEQMIRQVPDEQVPEMLVAACCGAAIQVEEGSEK